MKESKIIKNLLEKLLKQPIYSFPQRGEKLGASTQRGVYLIRNQKKQILHVGQTPRAQYGIKQRLSNHLQGLSSFVYYYFDGDGDKLRTQKCSYQCLPIEQSRRRALLEAYAIGCLCPKHIGGK